MPAIHPSAAKGYAKESDAYARGRPEYPAAVDRWLAGDLGLAAGKTAVDLGAGTGKFSRRLLATGARVVAVEPVAEMRARLAAEVPAAEAVAGAAEDIPLAAASVDAVVCAQSFHWFATARALAEIRRVLKPGGVLGLVWNARDESVDWVAALEAVVRPFIGDAPRHTSGAWRRAFPAEGFGPLEEKRFAHAHVGPPEDVVVKRILSTSFIAALPPERQKTVEAQVRDVIARTPSLAGRDEVTFPYETRVYRCRKVS